MNLPSPRTLLAAGAVAALSAAAAPLAHADDYCVNTDSCPSGKEYYAGSLQAALNDAAAHPGPDRVLIGPGIYVGPFHAGDGAVTEVVGTPQTDLVTTGTVKVPLTLNAKGAKVSTITLRRHGNGGSSLVLAGGSKATNVKAEAYDGVTGGYGVQLSGGSTIEGSSIEGTPNGGAVNVGGDYNRIHDSVVSGGSIGVHVPPGAWVEVERSRVSGFSLYGVNADGGHAEVEDSLVDARGASKGAAALAARSFANVSGPIVLTSFRNTVIGDGPGQTGMLARADNAGEQTQGVLRDTVIHGFGRPTECSTANGGETYLTGSSNLFPAQGSVTTCAGGSSKYGVSHSTAAPAFADEAAGDFRPAASSPLIDAGNDGLIPSSAALDAAGATRVVDGDGDGEAVQDIGAFERQAPASAPVPDPAPAPVPPAPSPDAGAPAPEAVPPAPGPAPAGPAADTSAPAIARLSVSGARTLRFSLSEAAAVTVVVERRTAIRQAGRRPGTKWSRVGSPRAFEAPAGKGKARLPRLKAGTYRVRIVAVDGAGNRGVSASRKLVRR
jgi:hypothetical protein